MSSDSSHVCSKICVRPDLLNILLLKLNYKVDPGYGKRTKQVTDSLRTCPPLILTINCQEFSLGNS